MEQVQYIYNNIKDNNEIAIVERYGNKAKHYTTVIATAFLFGVSLVLVAQLWRDFTDIILSVNISRPHHLQVTTEYFINQERYFYLLFFHLNTAVVVGCFVLTATGTMLVAYLQHACGMFRIASYRIETAIQIYISKNINMQNEILTYEGIIRAVDIHRKAMAFSTYLITRFEKSFMILIACGVLILAFSIFRISNIK
ncbi:PREDICTED: uncharacterized protein LOC105455026 [Wasmannia auropunctata]|uniref:uncharacterized protein LOC105455026 n=1 Tax=Wasmannia auropunctata TaxID=64793 RepID=UPI0005EF8CDD|nr:PREDICTED: uncharacterized protein LOC105455026 [Wasmannia auropunctata]